MDDVRAKSSLLEGFQSDPKFFPDEFAYDALGRLFLEDYKTSCLSNYFHEAEVDLLLNTPDIIHCFPRFPAIVDIGDGTEEIRKFFIENCLEKTLTLEYYPMRPLQDECVNLAATVEEEYGKRVDPRPIVEDIENGMERIIVSNKSFRKQKEKIFLWFGGRFCGYPYDKQLLLLSKTASAMKRSDVLLLTVDITKDAEQIKEAHLDPKGYASQIYLNNITRLNEEFGSDMKAEEFELETTYMEDNNVDSSSYVHVWLRSLTEQSIEIPKLEITLKLEEDEKIFVHEGSAFNEAQLADLGTRSGLYLQNMWANEHVALCAFRKREFL